MNHAVDVELSSNGTSAHVSLNQKDKRFVPHQDFVLYFRDQAVNKPTGVLSKGPHNSQAVSI